MIDWTLIDGPASARKFGDQLIELPRSFADRTSISGGIEFAAAQLERAPFQGSRRTIDVSGDGTNNAGRDVSKLRDEILAEGNRHQRPGHFEHPADPLECRAHQSTGGLEKYYQDNVVGGPGAFVLVAEDFDSFGRAIVKKLIAEIASLSPTPPVISR